MRFFFALIRRVDGRSESSSAQHLQSAAKITNLCQAMRDDTMWGGGGEVVGLTHVLKRPIHVYDLVSTGRR